MTNQDDWEKLLDQNPYDWVTRAVYADWLEDNDNLTLAFAQRWMVEHIKTPGPSCLLESQWYEASWFHRDQLGVRWLMNGRIVKIVKHEWCIPADLFMILNGQIKRHGYHTTFAKLWDGRRYAEYALGEALTKLKKTRVWV